MTQDQLNELTVLLERATPGPWTWGAKYLCSRPVGEEYKRLATALEPDSPKWCANAALIVALRNHAPALLARLADLERLREAVEKLSSLDLVSENTAWNLAYTEMIASLAKLTLTGETKCN